MGMWCAFANLVLNTMVNSFVKVLVLLLMMLATTGYAQDGEVFDEEPPFRVNPNHFRVLLAGTVLIAIAGTILIVKRSYKREKKKKEDLVAEISKAYKSGSILDTDHDELKKGLDPIRYAWLMKNFEYALSNKRRHDYLYSKYPKDLATDLFEQKHWIGMTAEQLIDSRGHAHTTDNEIQKTKTIKMYIYKTPNGEEMFSFVEGVLEKVVVK